MLEINDKKIAYDHGNVTAFLEEHGFTYSTYYQMKKKTKAHFKRGSKSFELKEFLKSQGYLAENTGNKS